MNEIKNEKDHCRYHCHCRRRLCRRHYRLCRCRHPHRNHRLSLGLAFRIAPRLALDERICNIHLPSQLYWLYPFQAHLYASTCQT